jgi:hypothetical protein
MIDMTTKLTQELADALRDCEHEPLPVVDPTNQQPYFVVEKEIHERAMRALRYVENVASVRRGLQSMDEGRGMSIDESQRRTEEAIRQLDLP